MSTADEASEARTIYGSDLKAGVDAISLNQTITFDLYTRVVLPLDGYVFWVKASQVTPAALYNAMGFNTTTFNATGSVALPAPTFTAQGSLHYATDINQTEAAWSSTNQVVFTSEQPIKDLNDVGPNLMYIAKVDGPTSHTPAEPRGSTAIMFSFSSRGSYYAQANLWHYRGMAVISTMTTQIVEDPRFLSSAAPIVSNSLPLWLSFNFYNPAYPVLVPRPNVLIYPSFLMPLNLTPPYVVAHIEDTEALQSAPYLSASAGHYALAKEKVTLTCYGLNNQTVQDLLDSLLGYSYDAQYFGVLNSPVPMDGKEPQREFGIIAQQKRMVFEISYNQAAVRNVARQLILSAIATVEVSDDPLPQQPLPIVSTIIRS